MAAEQALHRALKLVIESYGRACTQHPGWPADVMHGAVIIAEEAGEVCKAASDATYNHDNLPTLAEEMVKQAREETAQTAAVCLRFLVATESPCDVADHAMERQDYAFDDEQKK